MSMDKQFTGILELARQSRACNLFREGLYELILDYLRDRWVNLVVLVPIGTSSRNGEPFTASSVRTYAYITFRNLRYGVRLG